MWRLNLYVPESIPYMQPPGKVAERDFKIFTDTDLCLFVRVFFWNLHSLWLESRQLADGFLTCLSCGNILHLPPGRLWLRMQEMQDGMQEMQNVMQEIQQDLSLTGLLGNTQLHLSQHWPHHWSPMCSLVYVHIWLWLTLVLHLR